MEEQLTKVSAMTKQVREIPDRWSWIEPSIWTDRMLSALDRGVKSQVSECLFSRVRVILNGIISQDCHSQSSQWIILYGGQLFSGEPYAGEPHVRFGGRGVSNDSSPTPIVSRPSLVWIFFNYPSAIVNYPLVPALLPVIIKPDFRRALFD